MSDHPTIVDQLYYVILRLAMAEFHDASVCGEGVGSNFVRAGEMLMAAGYAKTSPLMSLELTEKGKAFAEWMQSQDDRPEAPMPEDYADWSYAELAFDRDRSVDELDAAIEGHDETERQEVRRMVLIGREMKQRPEFKPEDIVDEDALYDEGEAERGFGPREP
jgi:hypothetical protein